MYHLVKKYFWNKHILIAAIAFIYFLTVFFSVGYHYFDEHYQIIEFANYKLGRTQAGELAWEFNAQIRSATQPLIAFVIFKIAAIFGISDPYNQTLVLRLLSAIFSIWVIKYFISATSDEIDPKLRPYFIALSFFLWFLPYINVRFSSENWSGLLFMLAIALLKINLTQNAINRFFFIGLILGFSILFRYQALILTVGVVSWLVFINKSKTKYILVIISGLMSTMIIGLLLDRYFYGEWVFPIFNYFKENIINNISSHYGVLPWYAYIIFIVKSPVYPIGALIMFSLVYLSYKSPSNLIFWCIIQFLVIHSMIAHKELRFLFQIANFAPYLLVIAYDKLQLKKYRSTLIFKVIFNCLILINSLALICASTKGAGNAKLVLAKEIHEKFEQQNVNLVVFPGADPYEQITPRNIFYRDENVIIQTLYLDISDVSFYKKKQQVNLLIVPVKDTSLKFISNWVKRGVIVKKNESIPKFSTYWIALYNNLILQNSLCLYQIK